jgi:hypothetical protein
MAEHQTLKGKTEILAGAATLSSDALRDHLDELGTYYLPETERAGNEERQQEVRNLMARVSFELSMRDLDVSERHMAGSVA